MNKWVLPALMLLFVTCRSSHPQEDNFVELRNRMVREQIIGRGISDNRVIEAMKKVPRHLFVSVDLVSYAYEDHPLPIGYGQTISQPYIVAFMTEVLEPGKSKRILEIGTGSGYQAAILGELCDSVFSVEIVPELANRADSLLKELNYSNVSVKIGDGYLGWPEKSPFDAIIVTCAPTHIPDALEDQLAEKGKMIIPVGANGSVQELVLLTMKNGRLAEKSVLPVRFVPMVNEKNISY